MIFLSLWCGYHCFLNCFFCLEYTIFVAPFLMETVAVFSSNSQVGSWSRFVSWLVLVFWFLFHLWDAFVLLQLLFLLQWEAYHLLFSGCFTCCHSPTQHQHELELDLILGRNPPTTPPNRNFNGTSRQPRKLNFGIQPYFNPTWRNMKKKKNWGAIKKNIKIRPFPDNLGI